MRSKFDEQLNNLNQEMLHMGTMIEESIQKAIEAFINQDTDSAKEIMAGDAQVDREIWLCQGRKSWIKWI